MEKFSTWNHVPYYVKPSFDKEEVSVVDTLLVPLAPCALFLIRFNRVQIQGRCESWKLRLKKISSEIYNLNVIVRGLLSVEKPTTQHLHAKDFLVSIQSCKERMKERKRKEKKRKEKKRKEKK